MSERQQFNLSQADFERERRLKVLDTMVAPQARALYEDRFLRALPFLEQIVIDNPNIPESEFGDRVTVLSARFGLSRRQESLARFTFGKYCMDKFDVALYRDSIHQGECHTNPLVDIASRQDTFETFLRDIGVQEDVAGKVNTRFFSLETRIPSCFILHAKGNRSDILRALGHKGTYNGLGYFIVDWEADEKAKMSPATLQRLPLLKGKVMVIFHDDRDIEEEYKTRQHEWRHYLFNLYFKEVLPFLSAEQTLDLGARDELASYYYSETTPQLSVNGIIDEDKFALTPEKERDQVIVHLFDTVFELKRLELAGYNASKLISRLALVSHDLPDLTQRLRQIIRVESNISSWNHLKDFVREPESPKEFMLAVSWYKALVTKLACTKFGREKADRLWNTYLYHIAFDIFTYSGASRESIYRDTRLCVNSLLTLRPIVPTAHQHFIDIQIERLKRRLTDERVKEQKQEQWKQFLHVLPTISPQLFAEYEHLQRGTKIFDRELRDDFRDRYLEPLFEEWLQAQDVEEENGD